MTTDRSRRDVLKSVLAAAATLPLGPSVMAAGGALAAPVPAPTGAPGAVPAAAPGGDLLRPATQPSAPDPRLKGLKLGCASYSFRKQPLELAVKAIRRVGLSYVSIKDFHLPMKSTKEERQRVAQAFRDAGITPLSCGNVKLTADEAASRNAFEYVRDTGCNVMVCAPDAAALPMLEKLVKEYDVRLAIHNHGPEDKTFPSPYEVQKAVANLDPRIGYCIDVGHTARAGADPAKAIRDLHDRLYDVHFKDVTDKAAKSTKVECEVGRGQLDVPGMLRALLDVKFAGHVGFEHEKDPTDPLPGLAEGVGYVRGVLAAL